MEGTIASSVPGNDTHADTPIGATREKTQVAGKGQGQSCDRNWKHQVDQAAVLINE